MKNLITVAQYPKSEIPERYIRIRDLKELCLICQHWTSRRRDPGSLSFNGGQTALINIFCTAVLSKVPSRQRAP